MNTPSETWQQNHERKLRLKSIFDEDREPEEEMILCNFCLVYHKATEIQEMETYSGGRRENGCLDCLQYLEYLNG